MTRTGVAGGFAGSAVAAGDGVRGGATGCGDVGVTLGRLMRTTGAGAGAGGAATVGAGGAFTLILGGGGGAAAGGAARTAVGGGGAISVAGAVPIGGCVVTVGDTDRATGPARFPNSCRTASLMRADKSIAHSGQANVTGLRTISGDASNAYFAPQSHWIFIVHQGLGFNKRTFVPSGSAMAAVDGDDFISPSQNRNVPPYL